MSGNEHARQAHSFSKETTQSAAYDFLSQAYLGLYNKSLYKCINSVRVQMSEENSFGYILKSFLVRKGTRRGTQWTQEKLGARLDPPVTRVTINRWLNNVCLPTPEHLEQLITFLELSDEDVIALYGAAKLGPPKRRNLSPRNRLFTGRDKYLEQLANHFKTDTTVALSGLAGLGKTQLALEYAYRHSPSAYRAVLLVHADKATLPASYADLAEVLRLPEQNEREFDKRIQAVNRWLEDHTNWLLIMDNADDLSLARSFFPKADHGHILLTTRSQIVGGIARRIVIERMEPEEGLLFLLRRSDMLDVKAPLDSIAAVIRDTALEAVKLLDGHPLALDQAGAFIEDGGSFTGYIDLYHEQLRKLLDKRGSLQGADCDYPDTVVVTFRLCFDNARARHPLADDILHFCAFLHPDAIPDELFQHDDHFMHDKKAFKDGIEALLRYSLLTRNVQVNTFSMHRLVQAVLIDAMLTDLRRQWRERVVRALNAAFPKLNIKGLSQCERLLSHILVCATWSEGMLTLTGRVAELFKKAGNYLTLRGRYSSAETLLVRNLSINTQLFGVEHLNTASALINLTLHYLECDKYEQAELCLVRALCIQEKQLGTEHPDTASSLHLLAILYRKQGKYDQAELLYQRTFRILEKYHGPSAEHPGFANLYTSMNKWARLLHDQGL